MWRQGAPATSTIFGDDYPTRDGTCVRDYIHVLDLADAHLLALEFLRSDDPRMEIYNLGCGGEGHTIREVVALRGEGDGEARSQPSPARGVPAIGRCSWRLQAKARRELGWTPARDRLDVIIESAWTFRMRRDRA